MAPGDDELAAYNAAMTAADEMVLKDLRHKMSYEVARMQTTATPVPHLVLADTYDNWFKGWPAAASHDLIGDTPEDAFLNATKAPLRQVIRIGLVLWDRTASGDVVVDASALEDQIDPAALGLLRFSAVLSVGDFRKRLAKERTKGLLAHRRYTFTERPLIELANGAYIVLRPAWVLDRFCGTQLYWQTFFDFGEEKTLPGEQFSLAMNYVFESTVGYLFRRAMHRARPKSRLSPNPRCSRLGPGMGTHLRYVTGFCCGATLVYWWTRPTTGWTKMWPKVSLIPTTIRPTSRIRSSTASSSSWSPP